MFTKIMQSACALDIALLRKQALVLSISFFFLPFKYAYLRSTSTDLTEFKPAEFGTLSKSIPRPTPNSVPQILLLFSSYSSVKCSLNSILGLNAWAFP